MADLKVWKILSISLLALTVSCGDPRAINTVVKLKMSDQQLNDAIYRYLSIYDEVDPEVFNEFVRIVHENTIIFNYLTDAQTDPEFLPYLRKYSNLKMQYKNEPIKADVKVLFSTHPLKQSEHLNRNIDFSGYCGVFNRVIFIDRGFWEAHRDNEKITESVLFHELGHCDLNRKHFLLKEDFSSYIQIENFSFMNGGILQSLLFNLLNISHFKSGNDYSFYFQQIEVAKRNIDQTFTSMYEELFSKENTKDNIVCKNDKCIEKSQGQIAYEFENKVAPVLRHTTIGPSQGNDLKEILVRQQLQYICYFYNQSNYEPLNNYLEESNDMTKEEIIQYCQLNEFNNRRLL